VWLKPQNDISLALIKQLMHAVSDAILIAQITGGLTIMTASIATDSFFATLQLKRRDETEGFTLIV
jgi:hypothetical protein